MALAKSWKEKFIDALRDSGNVSKSCEIAKVARSQAYAERASNPVFAQQWENALEYIADDLEEVAKQRAIEGSDTLLIFLLKGLKPDKYRENRRLEVAGDPDAPLKIEITYADDSDNPTETT